MGWDVRRMLRCLGSCFAIYLRVFSFYIHFFGRVGARQEQPQRELLGKQLEKTQVALPQPLPAIFEGLREDVTPLRGCRARSTQHLLYFKRRHKALGSQRDLSTCLEQSLAVSMLVESGQGLSDTHRNWSANMAALNSSPKPRV